MGLAFQLGSSSSNSPHLLPWALLKSRMLKRRVGWLGAISRRAQH